ncbi:hypothetical protein HYH03_002738 [Edaphochlamys debaryana]|uniref:ABC transporter domain-containing protein n=1 Tax=Edaphochlamys debaryana TaxID=47281 RepID=A0A835YAQ1_9CHLO|nr:hypothetical protein HYH03_002738 [Edaphochlamys debaryana]|eukprot:KAG2499156.1 hypothetical protein HYH03_002738 [Edaphochlamys debaryana]
MRCSQSTAPRTASLLGPGVAAPCPRHRQPASSSAAPATSPLPADRTTNASRASSSQTASTSGRVSNGNGASISSAVRRTSSPYSVLVHDLHHRLGPKGAKRPVLNGVDLQIRRGSLHMLLGPNGCGKSTLLKLLGGLMTPDSGQIDTDLPSGFVFQNPDHQVVMPTVAADVAFGLGRYNLSEAAVSSAVRSSLRLVNMEDFMYRATHTLSGGQRQRVAIAGALAEDPKLLLLDELTTFLDREDQFGVLQAVRSITQASGDVTAIWVTHRWGAAGGDGQMERVGGGVEGGC